MVARFHYEDLIYKQLLADELPSNQQQSVTSHIEHCAACQSKLETLSQAGITWSDVHELLSNDTLTKRIESSNEATNADNPVDQPRLNFLEPSDHQDSLGRYGRYEIMEVLGRGGMGVVMRGYDAALNRQSAIKVLAPEFAANASARKRFSREAKSAAAVVHEHVIPILTVDEEQGLPYLVMPVVEGCSLEQRVNASGPLDTKETLRIGMQIASGLAAAHAQGLVHRDVKPANILLENGVERVMITDFGLARAVDDASMTRSGVIAGTPQYMSPEQARGNEVDFRSDLFSLGSVLYFMCTGRSPFRAGTTMGVLHRIVSDQPRSVCTVNPEVPEWLDAIIMRLLEKSADDRYGSAEEVSEELGEWLAHVQSPDKVPPPKPLEGDADRGGSKVWMKWLGGLAAGILALGVIILEMNKGTLEIDSSADANLYIKHADRDTVYKEIKVSEGKFSTRIAAGEYVIEVDGENESVEIDKKTVSLRRGGREAVRVKLQDPRDHLFPIRKDPFVDDSANDQPKPHDPHDVLPLVFLRRQRETYVDPSEIKWGPVTEDKLQLGVRPKRDRCYYGESVEFEFYIRTVGAKSRDIRRPDILYPHKIEAKNAKGDPLGLIRLATRFPGGIGGVTVGEKAIPWGTFALNVRSASTADQLKEELGRFPDDNYLLAQHGDECKLRFDLNGKGLTSGTTSIHVASIEETVSERKTLPELASIAIKATPGISNAFISVRKKSEEFDGSYFRLPQKQNAVRVVDGLVPGTYDVSLLKMAGPRHVRIGLQQVKLAAREFKRIEFPAPKGVALKGTVSGMASRGLTKAVFFLHRVDDQWTKKSMLKITADDAVGVVQDGEFQTDLLKQGWYAWTLEAYSDEVVRPNGGPHAFRMANFRLTGEVHVPASGEPEVLAVKIRAFDYTPDEKQKALLSNPDSGRLKRAVNEVREKLIEHNEFEFSALVSPRPIRRAVMAHIKQERAKRLIDPKNELERRSRDYFQKHVEPVLREVVAGGFQITCGLDAWYTGHTTKGKPVRMSLPLTASQTDIARNGFVRDGIVIRLEVTTPNGPFPDHAFHVMELKGLSKSDFGAEFPPEEDDTPDKDEQSQEGAASRPLVIAGTITDAKTGNRITDFNVAAIKYFRPDWTEVIRGRYRGEAKPKKAGDGTFTITANDPKYTYDVQIEALGYQTVRTTKQYCLGSEDKLLQLELQPCKRFRGRVLNAKGKPVEAARVYVADRVQQLQLGMSTSMGIMDEGMDLHLAGNYRVVTDEEGEFEICSPVEDITLVVMCEDGYAEAKRKKDANPGVITVQPWASLSGTVSQDGEAVPGFQFLFQSVRTHQFQSSKSRPDQPEIIYDFDGLSRTNNGGTFEIRYVPPIPFRLARDYDDPGLVELDLKPGEHPQLDLELTSESEPESE